MRRDGVNGQQPLDHLVKREQGVGREGIAVIGISQPLHADRAPPGTNPDLDSFNFYNPDAGRTNVRQGALDQVYLAEVLTRATASFRAGGETIRLDGAIRMAPR